MTAKGSRRNVRRLGEKPINHFHCNRNSLSVELTMINYWVTPVNDLSSIIYGDHCSVVGSIGVKIVDAPVCASFLLNHCSQCIGGNSVVLRENYGDRRYHTNVIDDEMMRCIALHGVRGTVESILCQWGLCRWDLPVFSCQPSRLSVNNQARITPPSPPTTLLRQRKSTKLQGLVCF